jgi:RNA polymerase sigma-54 factor
MKQTLQLKLSQHLTLTPQLQQSIRLLQLSTLELNQELEKFLADNPLLERDEAAMDTQPIMPRVNGEQATTSEAPAEDTRNESSSSDSPSSELDWLGTSAPSSGGRDDGDDNDFPQIAAESPTLREHLLSQLTLTNLDYRDRALVVVLIEALDDDGYLTQPLDELMELLPAELEVEIEELQIALRHLQHLDPIGVGARSCSECLELQLVAMPETTGQRALALAIAKHHLPLLAARDFARLRKTLLCSDDELRQAQHLIQSLNPRPGGAFSALETRYVISDVVVKKIKGVWVASLNPEAVPKLRINRMYADILQGNRNNSGSQLSQQLQEARWLIKNVQQRFETILRVSQAIVDRQRHFFEHGEVAMRPLVLREIADTLGLHESTVSRVTTQKFMFTPRGIFELKYFFGSHVSTETGGSCSATAIRALIKQLVGAEDSRKPLSDSKIAEILGQQGIVVARRTIAKYRESLHIPPVNLRKSL